MVAVRRIIARHAVIAAVRLAVIPPVVAAVMPPVAAPVEPIAALAVPTTVVVAVTAMIVAALVPVPTEIGIAVAFAALQAGAPGQVSIISTGQGWWADRVD